MSLTPVRCLAALGVLAAALSAAVLVGEWQLGAPHGLRFSLHLRPGLAGPVSLERVVAAPDLDLLASEPVLPLSFYSARWQGHWRVPSRGLYDLHLRSTGSAALLLNGQPVLFRRPAARARGIVRTVALEAGLHALEVTFDAQQGPAALKVLWARQGEPPRPLAPDDLFPPDVTSAAMARDRAVHVLVRPARLAWVALLLALSAVAILRRACWLPPLRPVARRLAPRAMAAGAMAIVLYGAVLRFEALVARYWYDGAPALAQQVRLRLASARPSGLVWLPEEDRYGADPFAYLRLAREPRGFYDAHVREPIHLTATRLFLNLAGGRDVGISFASATISALTVGATYLLGSAVASPAVGLIAAVCLAVERQVIGHSVEGWRDETFAFFAVLSAWALLRLQAHPCFVHALVAGLAGGLVCLSRLTSLSFVLPGFAWVIASGPAPRRPRAGWTLLSLGLLAVVVGPYLLTCALAFGDPLFAVNYHTGFYRVRSGLESATPMGWSDYLAPRQQPFRVLDTMLVGLTAYPFSNKWGGFDYWSRSLGSLLAAAALVGLALLAASARGRLFLLLLASSLLPFAFTWEVTGGAEWRFTLHAYPFYLVAAGTTLVAAVTAGARLGHFRGWLRWAAARRARLAAVLAALTGAAAAVWAAAVGVHYLRVREDVRAGRPALVEAGPRDRPFFGRGWYGPIRLGNLSVRCSRGKEAMLWLPLEVGRDYALTLRLAPFSFEGAPPQGLGARLNDRLVWEGPLERDPQWSRIYTVPLPASAVRAGRNRLELRARYSTPASSVRGGDQAVRRDWDTALLLRFLRIAPASPVPTTAEQDRGR